MRFWPMRSTLSGRSTISGILPKSSGVMAAWPRLASVVSLPCCLSAWLIAVLSISRLAPAISLRSADHTSVLHSLLPISYAFFSLFIYTLLFFFLFFLFFFFFFFFFFF